MGFTFKSKRVLKSILALENAKEVCSDLVGFEVSQEDVELLCRSYLLPLFRRGTEFFVLLQDILDLVPVIGRIEDWGRKSGRLGENLFDVGRPAQILLADDSAVDLPVHERDVSPAFYAALRNMIIHSPQGCDRPTESLGFFPPTRIRACSTDTIEMTRRQVRRAGILDTSRAGDFANSAHYMGAKRNLSSFLVECFANVLGEKGTLIDLMCGSGVVAGAAARTWTTYASDAQGFCRLLALIQGGGFSRKQAEKILVEVLPIARDHSKVLCGLLATAVDTEDDIFHGNLTEDLRSRYAQFISTFPLYPDAGAGDWNPSSEVEKRRQLPRSVPYVLFSTYFANIYFGLRQCIEIDSLRYAIDALGDAGMRRWALGALAASASRVGTTYAGHFAQPRVREWHAVTLVELSRLIEQRTLSVFHEFSVRLMNLAEESESVRHGVKIIEGPWRHALDKLECLELDKPVLVYVDPPYRREEYSRYYHVLETLIEYSYPSVGGIGRTPGKGAGGRFVSEFFTRSEAQMTQALARLIESVVDRGWSCAWSYSDSSDASIIGVLQTIQAKIPMTFRSYAVPYEHQSQRGRKPKKVTEYLIVIQPRA